MVSLVYSLFESFWRRLFGSDCEIFLIGNRAFQHILNASITFAILFWMLQVSLVQSLLASATYQGLYWARSHGCCYDFGRGVVDINRYEQLWYWKYLKKFIPEEHWYKEGCDWLLLSIRYSLPSILLALVLFRSFAPLFMGVVLAATYGLCWVAYDFKWTKRPTELAEFISGFTSGLLLTL